MIYSIKIKKNIAGLGLACLFKLIDQQTVMYGEFFVLTYLLQCILRVHNLLLILRYMKFI